METVNNNSDKSDNLDTSEEDDPVILQAAVGRLPEQIQELRRRRRENDCYQCGEHGHLAKDCRDPEDLLVPKRVLERNNESAEKERLRGAVFTVNLRENDFGDWSVHILDDENESEKVEGTLTGM